MTDSLRLTIAIDGPAGSGKSTIASHLARKFGYTNIETGAMYRALALKAIEWDVSFDDESALLKLAENSYIQLEPMHSGNRVLLDSRNVSDRIRERDVTEAASRVSVHPRVRQWMVDKQRQFGAGGGIVMEGRDIGTHVFPNADLKIFLDADPDVRAERRMHQHANQLRPEDARKAAAEIRVRDQRDINRAVAPLVPAADAVILDTSSMTLDQVIAEVERLVQEHLNQTV